MLTGSAQPRGARAKRKRFLAALPPRGRKLRRVSRFRYSAPVPAPRSLSRSLAAALALAAALVAPSAAHGFSPFLVVPDPAVAEASPAYRYANMTDAEAVAELQRRQVPYVKVDAVPGVRAPIRLAGKLHGVTVRSALPPDQRATSPFEILDARLALALDDFCALLEKHDIDELVHFTMYRPNAAPPPAPHAEEPSARAAGARPRPEAKKGAPLPAKASPAKAKGAPPKPKTSPTRGGAPSVQRVAKRDPGAAAPHATHYAPPGTRHPAGLAIDVGLLRKRDGRWISVARDFHGKLGARTCGEGAFAPESADGRELRALVCGSAAAGTFTYVLTPDYDAAHADHFHMEIKPGVRWFLYH